jgi:hypothetical protein
MNINYFKMTEVIGLKLLHRGPLEWHYLHKKIHENHTDRQAGTQTNTKTDRQTGDLISLLSILESSYKQIKETGNTGRFP